MHCNRREWFFKNVVSSEPLPPLCVCQSLSLPPPSLPLSITPSTFFRRPTYPGFSRYRSRHQKEFPVSCMQQKLYQRYRNSVRERSLMMNYDYCVLSMWKWQFLENGTFHNIRDNKIQLLIAENRIRKKLRLKSVCRKYRFSVIDFSVLAIFSIIFVKNFLEIVIIINIYRLCNLNSLIASRICRISADCPRC